MVNIYVFSQVWEIVLWMASAWPHVVVHWFHSHPLRICVCDDATEFGNSFQWMGVLGVVQRHISHACITCRVLRTSRKQLGASHDVSVTLLPCGGSIPEDDNQCISNSPSSLCQNAAFTRCRSENGYRPEQIHLSLAEPIGMRVAWKTSADAQIKFLAAEALHGAHRLALNKAASGDIAWQCKHYSGRGVMKLHESGTALAEGYGSSRLEDAGFD